jgi:dTDP-4-amino-4,6-dideoxygalactose transaminase
MYTGYYKVNPHESPFKCSISAVNALLILEQLNFIENIKQKRIKNYQTLKEELPTILESIPDSPLFFSLNFNRKMTVKTLRKIQFEFLRQGIQTHIGVLSFDFFTKPIAYKYVLSLPCHTELNEDQIVHITHTTKKILKQNEI